MREIHNEKLVMISSLSATLRAIVEESMIGKLKFLLTVEEEPKCTGEHFQTL